MTKTSLSFVTPPDGFIGMHRINPADRLFTPINDLIIILSALGYSFSIIEGADVHSEPDPTMLLDTQQMNYAFVLPLGGALKQAFVDVSPEYIEIAMTRKDYEVKLPKMWFVIPLRTTGMSTVAVHIISPIFISFFERYNEWLDDTRGEAIN